MNDLKDYIQQIQNNAEAHISINNHMPQTFVINPTNLKYLCILALRELENCTMKYCKKHNQKYYDYVPGCPICYGETLTIKDMTPPNYIHDNHPDMIDAKNNERKDKFKRKMEIPIIKKEEKIEKPESEKKFKRKPKNTGFF